MLIAESIFEDFLTKQGTLSATQISQGATSHGYIRDLLANKSDLDPKFPRLVDGDFLSGSYARGTKIYPLDDIDVMLVMDGQGFFPIDKGQVLNATVRGSGKTDNPLLGQVAPNGLLSSRLVLDYFKKALEQSHASSKVAKDGSAVNVWLDSYGLGIDVVPAFHIVPRDGSQDFYYIPVGTNNDGWKMTNPKIDERISEQLHEYHNKKLKSVIRLLKLWNRLYNAERLRSYHLETVAWRVFNSYSYPGKITHSGLAVMYFFENAYQQLAVPCPDETRLGCPVDVYLSEADRLATLRNILETQKILKEGFGMGFADESRQLSGWRKIYGTQFGV